MDEILSEQDVTKDPKVAAANAIAAAAGKSGRRKK